MKKTNTLPFISLLIIATMIFVPLIVAQDFGGEFGGFDSGGFDGGEYGGFDSGGFDGGDFGGFDSGGFDGGEYGGFDSGGFDGGEYGGTDSFDGGDDYTGAFDTGPDFGGFPGPDGVPPTGDPGDFPTEADAAWEDLPDVTIPRGSPDGTLIQEDVFSKCTDPDSDILYFEITSTSANYELFFIDDDIRIFDLDKTFVGTETATVTCNGVPESFALSVVESGVPPKPGPTPDVEDSDRLSVFIGAIIMPDAYSAEAGMEVPVTISFKNNGDHSLEDLEGSVAIQDLSVRASFGPLDLPLGKRVSKTVTIELPEDVEPGTYTARIEIYSGSVHRIKHRDVEVIS